MRFREYVDVIGKDLFRYGSDFSLKSFLRSCLLVPGYKYTFWMRTAAYLRSHRPWTTIPYAIARLALNHYTYRYGIHIPYNTEIGAGLYIGHFGGIEVSYRARIGRNCNLNCGVLVGATYGGRNPGAPTILDRVFIGAGAKILGGITIGNDVAIGANAVVVESLPDNSVIVTAPGRIVSQKGSGDYVCNTTD